MDAVCVVTHRRANMVIPARSRGNALVRNREEWYVLEVGTSTPDGVVPAQQCVRERSRLEWRDGVQRYRSDREEDP